MIFTRRKISCLCINTQLGKPLNYVQQLASSAQILKFEQNSSRLKLIKKDTQCTQRNLYRFDMYMCFCVCMDVYVLGTMKY